MKIDELHLETPLVESLALSRCVSRPVWLKLEALQPCGSFKARGLGFACRRYVGDGRRRLVTSSGGNAGLAVAYSGRRLGVPVTVVVPSTTRERARQLLRDEAAEVVVFGQSWQEAHEHAQTMLDADDAYVHPFDDPLVWEGHSSLVREVLDSGLDPGSIVVSVGGGGLLCGVAMGLEKAGRSDVTIVTAETEGAESFDRSVRAGELVELTRISSVATTLGAKKVAKEALDVSRRLEVVPHVVTDREAVEACLRFAADHRVIVEPACGAALALAYKGVEALRASSIIVLVVCGGAGVSYDELRELEKTV